MVQDFEDLVIYQKARELAKLNYSETDTLPWKNDFRFVQQIRAAVGSISDNIAEGFERQGNKEFIQFLYIAKGSCGEVRSQLNRALDVNYIDNDSHERLCCQSKQLGAAILRLIQKTKNFENRGSKYTEHSEK